MVQHSIRSMTPLAERGVTDLAPKGLDRLSPIMLAVPDQCMDRSVYDPEVETLVVGTSKPFGVDAFGGSMATFQFRSGTHRHRRWPSI